MPNITEALRQYFSPVEVAEFSIAGNAASAGGVTFSVTREGVVVSSATDDWLSREIKGLPRDRAVWAATAWLKVRHFATPEEITALARSGKIYNEDYYTKRGGGSPYVNYPLQESGFDGQVAFADLADHIVKNFHPTSALDCGCATGVLVKALQERGVDAFGVDISDYATSHAVTGNIYRASAEKTPFAEGQFDFIISQDFMEHIAPEMIGAVLLEQVRISRPGAKIAHFIPFEPGLHIPRQSDVHLCEASRGFWVQRIGEVPQLRIDHLPPETDQWAPGADPFSKYFVLTRT